MDTINCFSEAMRSADEICMNVRRMRCRQVAVYLHWLYQHGITKQDYSLQLPEFKRIPAKLPQTWSKEEIEQILAAIDTENPTGKRNYAMFLLMARTGLRISDVVSLRFSNIDWKNSTISLSQQKTGNNLGLPLSKELGRQIHHAQSFSGNRPRTSNRNGNLYPSLLQYAPHRLRPYRLADRQEKIQGVLSVGVQAQDTVKTFCPHGFAQ